MFTGLITDVGNVASIIEAGDLRRIRIHCAYDPQTIAIGASIACSGPCLTVAARGLHEGGAWFDVDAAAETLARTTVGGWRVGTRVNLERSLKIGDELGGHLVAGHIDATAEIVARHEIGTMPATVRFEVLAPTNLRKFIAEKGSVSLDGTSLTVNHVGGDVFSVLLIPHSLAATTWGEAKLGDRLNLEVDLMARYAARRAEVEARDPS